LFYKRELEITMKTDIYKRLCEMTDVRIDTSSLVGYGLYKSIPPNIPIYLGGTAKKIFTDKDITYFPMTWAFMVTEFGADFSWNQATGLVINVAPPEPEVIVYEDVSQLSYEKNALVNVNVYTENGVTYAELDKATFPVDYDQNVASIWMIGLGGEEMIKLTGKDAYAIVQEIPQHIDINRSSKVDNNYKWKFSNDPDTIDAYSFFDTQGNLIGSIVLQKLNLGTKVF